MKKNYIKPNIVVYKVTTDLIIMSSLPNDKWSRDENGNAVNPGGHIPPGHNKLSSNYRNNLWDE